jgi:hypothetical protein
MLKRRLYEKIFCNGRDPVNITYIDSFFLLEKEESSIPGDARGYFYIHCFACCFYGNKDRDANQHSCAAYFECDSLGVSSEYQYKNTDKFSSSDIHENKHGNHTLFDFYTDLYGDYDNTDIYKLAGVQRYVYAYHNHDADKYAGIQRDNDADHNRDFNQHACTPDGYEHASGADRYMDQDLNRYFDQDPVRYGKQDFDYYADSDRDNSGRGHPDL